MKIWKLKVFLWNVRFSKFLCLVDLSTRTRSILKINKIFWLDFLFIATSRGITSTFDLHFFGSFTFKDLKFRILVCILLLQSVPNNPSNFKIKMRAISVHLCERMKNNNNIYFKHGEWHWVVLIPIQSFNSNPAGLFGGNSMLGEANLWKIFQIFRKITKRFYLQQRWHQNLIKSKIHSLKEFQIFLCINSF